MASMASESPCVVCNALPTVAYSYAPGRLHGRVCRDHANEAVKAGHGVAGDKPGALYNWNLESPA